MRARREPIEIAGLGLRYGSILRCHSRSFLGFMSRVWSGFAGRVFEVLGILETRGALGFTHSALFTAQPKEMGCVQSKIHSAFGAVDEGEAKVDDAEAVGWGAELGVGGRVGLERVLRRSSARSIWATRAGSRGRLGIGRRRAPPSAIGSGIDTRAGTPILGAKASGPGGATRAGIRHPGSFVRGPTDAAGADCVHRRRSHFGCDG